MTTLYWCPNCARIHGDDEINLADGPAKPRCALTGVVLEAPPPPEPPPHVPPELVSLTPRPKLWHCIFCGWRCEESWNDYMCHQCQALRPFMGGSATMMQCNHCAHWNLALARFCEWCGAGPGRPTGYAGGSSAPEPAPDPAEAPSPILPPPAGAQADLVAQVSGLPRYPDAQLLGEQRIVSADASILWHAFTSGDEPEVVVAYYLAALGPEGFSADGPGGIWRWPADDPGRVLHILRVDDLGPHQQLTGKPPADARSVIIVSQRFIEA